MTITQLLFSFSGRISRKPFWLFVLATGAVMLVPAIFVFGIYSEAADNYIDLCAIFLLWPSLAIQAKRWHDRDKSAWWILINFIPLIGSIWSLVENGLLEGTPGVNRFGSNPLASASINEP